MQGNERGPGSAKHFRQERKVTPMGGKRSSQHQTQVQFINALRECLGLPWLYQRKRQQHQERLGAAFQTHAEHVDNGHRVGPK